MTKTMKRLSQGSRGPEPLLDLLLLFLAEYFLFILFEVRENLAEDVGNVVVNAVEARIFDPLLYLVVEALRDLDLNHLLGHLLTSLFQVKIFQRNINVTLIPPSLYLRMPTNQTLFKLKVPYLALLIDYRAPYRRVLENRTPPENYRVAHVGVLYDAVLSNVCVRSDYGAAQYLSPPLYDDRRDYLGVWTYLDLLDVTLIKEGL